MSYNRIMQEERRPIPQPRPEAMTLSGILHALSDPIRLEIVLALHKTGEERPCGTLPAPVSKSTLTHHFRVLREAGLIAQRQDGTARLTKLRSAEIEARFPGVLEPILDAARERSPLTRA
ncbi:MAG: helix-turn-helix domain-containing protein [Thermoleophilaceae bacterium]